jgi:branched-chain amino acid transport system ATP-binding protein
VFENVLLGAHLSQRSSFLATLLGSSASRGELGEVDRLVRTALDTVGLAGQADEQVDSLPYGIRRKVEIARAMVRSPSVLLLDEPTAGMAASERDDIFQLVRKLSAKGVAVVVVEHDVMSMTTHCDLVVVLNFGHVVAVGAPNEVMREEAVIDAYIGRAAHR